VPAFHLATFSQAACAVKGTLINGRAGVVAIWAWCGRELWLGYSYSRSHNAARSARITSCSPPSLRTRLEHERDDKHSGKGETTHY
jgi:hypothetical protein